ncbi:MAG: hypothetical protein AB7V62_11420 [Thermoleophilia bacterium]
MPPSAVTDEDLAVVAAVAIREGWTDLSAPPEAHGPRTLGEERAVAAFQGAVPRPAKDPRRARIRARIIVVALSVVVLGACWMVSPTRTAIGLIGAGLFSLIALRRAKRRAEKGIPPKPPRRALLGRLGAG